MNEWNGVPEDITLYAGFIYIFTNLKTKKFYIGQKTFFKKVDKVKDKEFTKPMFLKRQKLQEKLDQGFFKTKKEYNVQLILLKKEEKEHFSSRKYKTKKVKKETNWREYWGSSDIFKADVGKFGKDNYERKILICCETKGMMNYAETFLQMKYGVVFNDKAFNGLVNIRANTKMFQNYHKECQIMLKKLNSIVI